MVFPKRFIKIWKAAASLTTRSTPPPLSYEQALGFFDQMANREDLALGYAQECCFARAHLMCESALQAGHMPKKAWAIDEDNSGRLSFTMPNGVKIRYWCHTAMVLPVKTPSGEIIDMVFDPALLDGPETLKGWGRVIGAPSHFLEIKRLGKPPTNYVGDYDTKLRTTKVLTDPKHERHPLQTIRFYQPHEIIPRTVFASQFCRDYIFPALGQWPPRVGNGWSSIDPLPKPTPLLSPGGPTDAPRPK